MEQNNLIGDGKLRRKSFSEIDGTRRSCLAHDRSQTQSASLQIGPIRKLRQDQSITFSLITFSRFSIGFPTKMSYNLKLSTPTPMFSKISILKRFDVRRFAVYVIFLCLNFVLTIIFPILYNIGKNSLISFDDLFMRVRELMVFFVSVSQSLPST